MQGLRGIKGDEVIFQFDLYFLYFSFFLLFLGVLFSLYFGYKYFKKNKKLTKRELSLLALKKLDFETNDTKFIVYSFSYHGAITLEEHFKDEFLKLQKQLQPFKYKKEVGELDADLKEQIKEYIKVRIR